MKTCAMGLELAEQETCLGTEDGAHYHASVDLAKAGETDWSPLATCGSAEVTFEALP